MRELTSVLKLTNVQSQSVSERFEDLYRTHRLPVYRFISRQGVDPSAAQDLTQEVFLRRWHAEKRNVWIDSDQSWLYSVAAKVTIDYWHGQGNPRWVSFEAAGLVIEEWSAHFDSPERVYEDDQKERRVMAAMADLPLEHRMAFELRVKGLRYREIASALGVGTSTAAAWLSNAVKTLRRAANA